MQNSFTGSKKDFEELRNKLNSFYRYSKNSYDIIQIQNNFRKEKIQPSKKSVERLVILESLIFDIDTILSILKPP